MAKANFDGKSPESMAEKVKLINKERYPAVMKDVVLLEDMTKFDGTGVENKIMFIYSVDVDGKTHDIPRWVAPIITKGSGKYSSSTLYEDLNTCDKLDASRKLFENKTEVPDVELVEWLKKELKDTKSPGRNQECKEEH